MNIRLHYLNNLVIYVTIFLMIASLVTKLYFYENYPIIYYFFGLMAFISLLTNFKYFYSKGWELKFFLPFIFMFISIITYSTFSVVLRDVNNINSLQYISDIFLNGIVWFCIGISLYFFDFSKKKILFPLLLSLILIFSIILNMGSGFFVDYYVLRKSINDNSISHLHFGDFFVFIIIISFLISKNSCKLPVLFLGLFALLGIGGRSNFYIFTFTVVFISLFYLKDIIFKYLKFLLLIFLMSIVIFIKMDFNISIDSIGRMAISKSSMDYDDSYVARVDFLNFAISDLVNNFLYGNPNLLIKNYGYINSYAHNLLSAWQFFGFFSFCSISLLLIYSFLRFLLALNRNCYYFYNENFMLGLFILTYISLSLVLTKGISFMFLWLGLGYIMSLISFLNKKMV